MRLLLPIILLLSIVFFSSCKNETEMIDPIELGLDYAPVEIGNYWIYKSDSLVYRQGGLIRDTLLGFIKEEIVDTFRDEENLLNYKLERSFKRLETDTWEMTDLWFSTISESSYIRNEENLKFKSLIFPITEGVDWDGNVFFDENVTVIEDGEALQPYKNWNYEYVNVDTTYSNDQFSAGNAILVQHIDDEIVIEKRVSSEMYAQNVGLVQKKLKILNCQACGTLPGTFEENAESGYIFQLDLIEHN